MRRLGHDLRSPLTSISGAAELLETGRLGEVTASQRKCLEVIHKGIEGLVQLIEQATAPYRAEDPEGHPSGARLREVSGR